MSSLWIHEPGKKDPRKLKGHMDPLQARATLATRAVKVANANKCAVVSQTADEVVFRYPDGVMFTMFVEHASPPSAPENGQPKIKEGHGVLSLGRKVIDLGAVS